MKISLALSGGGIRAMAHLGVIEVLVEYGYEIGAVSGSSGGALVGAFLCDGKKPHEIFSIFEKIRLKDLAGSSGNGGVFGLGHIQSLLEENLDTQKIEHMPIPLIVACTDIAKGNVVYFKEGPAATLCVASSSLVPIFSPVVYKGVPLADGGFMDNMPAKPLIDLSYPVIGINVNPILPGVPDGILSVTLRVLMLMMRANIDASKRFTDFYIEPKECAKMNIFDLKRGKEAYEAGVRAARDLIENIENTLCRAKKG